MKNLTFTKVAFFMLLGLMHAQCFAQDETRRTKIRERIQKRVKAAEQPQAELILTSFGDELAYRVTDQVENLDLNHDQVSKLQKFGKRFSPRMANAFVDYLEKVPGGNKDQRYNSVINSMKIVHFLGLTDEQVERAALLLKRMPFQVWENFLTQATTRNADYIATVEAAVAAE